jgi:hypothetical protein
MNLLRNGDEIKLLDKPEIMSRWGLVREQDRSELKDRSEAQKKIRSFITVGFSVDKVIVWDPRFATPQLFQEETGIYLTGVCFTCGITERIDVYDNGNYTAHYCGNCLDRVKNHAEGLSIGAVKDIARKAVVRALHIGQQTISADLRAEDEYSVKNIVRVEGAVNSIISELLKQTRGA